MKTSTKYGVLDVGSNSVRALLYSDGKILYTGLITSRLGEGLAQTGNISALASERTVSAISVLGSKLKELGADEIYPFATEAVRSAKNSEEFLSAARSVGYEVEVIGGDEEGELGLLGALGGADGGIIDIGGASTEITAAEGGKIIYSHSLPLGAVRLHDMCGEDETLLKNAVIQRISEYGQIPATDYNFIGGTATAMCMVAKSIDGFEPEKVDGSVLTYAEIVRAYERLRVSSVDERVNALHLSPKRAEIIVGGAYMIMTLCDRFSLDKITVKVNDNMLGYIKKRILGEGYEKA